MIAETTIPSRTIKPDVLAALKKTHPIEGAAAEILIKRGVWCLEAPERTVSKIA
ncbi:hypothetical protein [Methanofollis ethanolicus]|uniref:hypothetical protein n=1 Tax=Methanofollis ethanolicus TaxID=488124 RepID=UPI0013662096|nr:hypothetical protein [Methanofollis ethanolicus]